MHRQHGEEKHGDIQMRVNWKWRVRAAASKNTGRRNGEEDKLSSQGITCGDKKAKVVKRFHFPQREGRAEKKHDIARRTRLPSERSRW